MNYNKLHRTVHELTCDFYYLHHAGFYMAVRTKLKEVPRTPEDPSPVDVYQQMAPGEPYTPGELAQNFDAERTTIRRRLETLREDGFVRKKKHAANRVSYWVPADEEFSSGRE